MNLKKQLKKKAEFFVNNLLKLWIFLDLSLRQKFQKTVFPEGVLFENGIIGTQRISTVFRALSLENEKKSIMMVAHRGVEPLF